MKLQVTEVDDKEMHDGTPKLFTMAICCLEIFGGKCCKCCRKKVKSKSLGDKEDYYYYFNNRAIKTSRGLVFYSYCCKHSRKGEDVLMEKIENMPDLTTKHPFFAIIEKK